MSYPKATITLANGALGGLLSSNDRQMGAVITGATEGSVIAGTPFTITSLEDLETLGVTSASTLNARLYKDVKEHYAELQSKGLLSLLVVASTMTVSQACDIATAGGGKKLLDYARGINVIGFNIKPQASPTVTNGINALTYTAATNLQAMLNTYATAQQPMRGVVAADSYDGTAGNLTNMKASTLNRVAILVGDTANTNDGGCIGLLFGRLAKVSPETKISRVKDGALTTGTAYVGTAAADTYASGEQIHDKGFITIRTIVGRNGFFFSSDPTCVADSDDYATLSRGRVIDKAQRIAYQVYVNEVDDKVPTEKDGTVEPGYAKNLEALIDRQINLSMTANGEISGFKSSVPLDQNVLQTNKVKVIMKVQPVGYASLIDVSLGFASSL